MPDSLAQEETGESVFTNRDYLLLFGVLMVFFLPVCELGYAAIKHVDRPNLLGLSICSYATMLAAFFGGLAIAPIYYREDQNRLFRFFVLSISMATLGIVVGETRYWLPQLVCGPHGKISDAPSIWGVLLAWQLPSIKAKARSMGKRPL